MPLSPVAREAAMASVHAGTARALESTVSTRAAIVVEIDPANRFAVVSAVGQDPTPFPAEVMAPVHLFPGDPVVVMFTPPHGAIVIGRQNGDHDDWHLVGDEGEPQFGSGWAADAGTGPPSFNGPAVPMFTRRGDRVELRGRAERVSGTNNTVFALPEPYWPDNDLLVPAQTALGAHEPLVIDHATGNLVVSSTSIVLLVMDGVSFLARAPRALEA